MNKPYSVLYGGIACVVIICVGVYVHTSRFSDTYVNKKNPQEIFKESRPVLFVGDIMMGRYVETLANTANDPLRSFREIELYLKEHTTIGNLEGPIPEVHIPTPVNGFSFSFPSSTPATLKEAGITAVSLANNHMLDQGRSGYEATKKALASVGLLHFGGYSPTAADHFETTLGTQLVIVYGVTMIATGWDQEQALSVTEKLRSKYKDAHLVAFLHWGDEYVSQNKYQREFAHALIDRGVDTIIGAHPHVVQGIEVYKEKPIFYSLSNFVFDQWWRDDVEDGYMVKMNVVGGDYVYELIPVHSVRAVIAQATSTKRNTILKKMADQSDENLQVSIVSGRILVKKQH